MHHFNQLTPAEAERLALAMEEMGEAIQAIGKILRHGYESRHPSGGPTNRQALECELGDVYAAIGMLCDSGDTDIQQITSAMLAKDQSVQRYLHHQAPAAHSGQ